MQRADYRLVRSRLTVGVMMGMKQSVFPKTIDHLFSSWLYGQRKSIEQIPVDLSRSAPCLVCSNNDPQQSDLSLINVDFNLFIQSLPLFNREQLSTLDSLLSDDRHVYENAIRQQYQLYKQMLLRILKDKLAQRYYLVR